MRLGLEPDANVFDWAGDDGVGDSSEGTGEVILGVGQWGRVVAFGELSASPVEGAELY